MKRVGRFPVERSLWPRSIDRTEDERNFVKTLNARYVTRYKILLSWKSKPTLFPNISFWIFHLQSKNPRKFFSSPKLIQNSFRSWITENHVKSGKGTSFVSSFLLFKYPDDSFLNLSNSVNEKETKHNAPTIPRKFHESFPRLNFPPRRILSRYRPRGWLIEVAHVWPKSGRKTAVKPPPPPYKAFHGYQFSRRMMLLSKLGAETGRMPLGRAVWASERDKSIRQTIINVAGGFALIVDTRLFDIPVSLSSRLVSTARWFSLVPSLVVAFLARDCIGRICMTRTRECEASGATDWELT